jgi:hypothetical protein
MATNPASPGDAEERVPYEFTHLSPTHASVGDLVQRWSDARMRALLARHHDEPDPKDLFAELAYGALIAREVTAGRWCMIAELLRAGAVDTWPQIATAMDTTETEARDGFHHWLTGQVDLRHRTGSIGITDAKATELYALSEAVTW